MNSGCPFGRGQVLISRGFAPAALFFGLHGQKRGVLIGGRDGELGEGVFDPVPGVDAELLAGGGEAGEDCQSAAAVVFAKKSQYLSFPRSGRKSLETKLFTLQIPRCNSDDCRSTFASITLSP